MAETLSLSQSLRYEVADEEWTAIKRMLPNKPRGVPRVNDRRVLGSDFPAGSFLRRPSVGSR
jgi:hypothetical protein